MIKDKQKKVNYVNKKREIACEKEQQKRKLQYALSMQQNFACAIPNQNKKIQDSIINNSE